MGKKNFTEIDKINKAVRFDLKKKEKAIKISRFLQRLVQQLWHLSVHIGMKDLNDYRHREKGRVW